MDIKKARIALAWKIWDQSDKITAVRNRMQDREFRFFQEITRHVPVPSRVVSYLGDLLSSLAFYVDSPCPVCKWSPRCSPSCTLNPTPDD